jgi:hypothetical protein
MKRMAWMVAGAALLLLAVSGAAAQSLGDVARSVRKEKEKAQQNTASRHFDNDNIPRQTHLSVVGQETAPDASETEKPASEQDKQGETGKEPSKTSAPEAAKDSAGESKTPPAENSPENKNAKESAGESKAPPAENKDGKDDWSKKLEAQKAKIDGLSQELDVTQREYRLRAVAMYSDAGNRLRNSAEWDKDDAQYKKDIADKQAAVDAAKQELTEMQEQARQAGAPPSDLQ